MRPKRNGKRTRWKFWKNAAHKAQETLNIYKMRERYKSVSLPHLLFLQAKSNKHFNDFSPIDTVSAKHLRLQIIGSITLDCRNGQADPMSEAFLQMAGVFSQLELSMIRARVRSGMANAKAKGKQIGRPQTTAEDIPPIFFRHYPAFAAGSLNVSELARVCNLSRTTVYKYIGMMNGGRSA